MRHRWFARIGALLIAGGSLLGAEQLWLSAKARLAGVLIERAFQRHLIDGETHPPWSWADTAPLARLRVPRLGLESTVLAGASGASLAFGPGHIDGTSRPGTHGPVAIAGHRDGAFAFLESLRVGDRIELETRHGHREYRVARLSVHSMWDASVLEHGPWDRLTLITCYPFDSLRRSSQRYVVRCVPVET